MEYQSLLQLLVLSATVFSVRSNCPSTEDIYPCTCEAYSTSKKLDCNGRNASLAELKSVLSYFSKEKEIISIELENLALGTLPSNLFDGIAVKELRITHCEINFEADKPPLKGLEDSLQFLKIDSSLTQKHDPLNLKFGHLEYLETLHLDNNKIRELDDDVFSNGNSKLRFLTLNNNGIEKIGEKTFEKLENLGDFELSGNKFGSLRRNMIPTSAKRLYIMDFSNNGLSDLPEDIFTNLPFLEYISLHQNDISTMDRSTWESIVDQLRYIDLEDNPLQCDSDMEWLVDKRISADVIGTCAGPAGKEGLSLHEFLKTWSY